MMKKMIVLLCLVAGLAPAVHAEEDPAIAVAVELLDAMRFDQQMEAMKNAMVPMMQQQQRQMMTEMGEQPTPAVQKVMDEYMQKITEVGFTPEMVEAMSLDAAAVYANVFTVDEMQAMLDFYRSAAGQSMLDKMPQATQQMMQLVSESQQAMTSRVVELMQQMEADIKAAMAESE